MSHINTSHEEDIATRVQQSTTPAHIPFNSLLKTKQVHAWLEVVILGLQPFSIVQNLYFTKHLRNDKISINMFMKYLDCLTKVVEKKAAGMLPKRFAILLDGWSLGDTHLVSVFANFPADTVVGYGKALSGLSHMENEENQGAQEH